MAERVFKKKEPAGMRLPQGDAGSFSTSATVPSASAESGSAERIGEQQTPRVFKKKTAPTTERVFTVTPQMKEYRQQHRLNGLQKWSGQVSDLNGIITTYFEDVNSGAVPEETDYNAIMSRIDEAASAAEQHRAAFADDTEVSAYLDDVTGYLQEVRAEVEKYRNGMEGVLAQEMADRVAAADENPLQGQYGKLNEATQIDIANMQAKYRLENLDKYNHADDKYLLDYAASTAGDIALRFADGFASLPKGIAKGVSGVIAVGADNVGLDDWAENIRDNIEDNQMDYWYDDIRNGLNIDETSLLDRNAVTQLVGGVAQGAGYVAGLMTTAELFGALGLSAAGIAMCQKAVIFISAMGNAMTEAYRDDATDAEAFAYGISMGAIELITEGMTNAVDIGIGKGALGLDDALATRVGNAIVKKMGTGTGAHQLKTLSQMAIKSGFEGLEGVASGFLGSFAKEFTYQSEKEWKEILSDERLFENFLVEAITAAVMQTPAAVQSIRSAYGDGATSAEGMGRDLITGRTYIQQEAIETMYDDHLSAAENRARAKGETLTNRQKKNLYNSITTAHDKAGDAIFAIEREVLESGKAVGYDADAVDTVARAAVALNQRVRFGRPQNANMAAEYDRATDTVVLNPVLTDTNLLIGEMLAHEMVHTAEGTAQLQKLERIAQRMEGAEGWERLKAEVKSEYAKVGKQLSDAEVQKETLAHWIGKNLFKNKAFAKAVADGDAGTGLKILYLIDRLRRALGAKKASAGNLAMLERLFMQALDNRTHGTGEGVQGALAFGSVDKEVLGSDTREVIKILHNNFEKIPSHPVFSVKMENDASSFEKKSEYILDIFQKQGGIAHNSVLGDVELSKKGAKSTIMHGYNKAKLASVWAIKDVIEQGAIVHTEPQYRGKEIDRHIIAARGYIDGTPTYMGIVVASYPNQPKGTKAKFYLHEAVIIDAKKEAGFPSMTAPQLSVDTVRKPASDTNVAQKATDVKTQSMQEGAGIFTEDGRNTAQGALLPPEYRPGSRAEGAKTPSVADGDTSLGEGGLRAVEVDEDAVLESAVRSQLQGRKQVDVSDLKKTNRRGQTNYDHNAAIDRLETELGKDEMLRRMYNATRMDRPKGTVAVDGRQVDANTYMDAYERQLPNDVAALEQKIRQLEKQRSDEILRMEQEGKLEGYTFGGLKLDLQLFAAKRKYDLLQLDPGESGTEVRQFYEKRLRGTDANHNDELVEMLSGRTETYNPICNEETLADAKKYLDNKKNEDSLLQRIGEYNNDDLFDAKEVAAAIVLINRAVNDGDLGEAADMIIGLSRKGTIAGRAVQAYSMMARMTPEGTLKAAIRTMRAEADTIICKGASEKLDVLADDIVKAIEEAEDNGLSSKEIIDRIRKGVVGKDAPVQFDHVPQDLADQVSEATGTDVTGYTIVVSTEAMQAIVDDGANVETLVDTDAETLQIIVREGTDTGTIETDTEQQLIKGKKRLPAKLTREELVQLLSKDLAGEKGNFFTQEEIYDLLWKTVNEAKTITEQVKRYVLKKIRKDDGGLAQRIYELHKRGDLKQTKLRRAMEEALELPHLTDEDLKWIVEKGTEIQSLESDPVKQADAMEELYDYLGAKMHVSTLEMLAAWRKFGMLFNVKTHLRNIFSNAAYKYVRKADAAVAMAIERIFVKDESKRGAALGWSHTEHGQSIMPELKKQVELAVMEMQGRGPKYEQGSNPLKRHRKMFGTSKLGEKLNATSDWNSERLEAEDIRFFRPAYIDALGQLMTARGETEITTELHDIAMQRALEATFRNRNYISEWLSAPRRGLNSDKEFVRVMASLYDVVIPFVNTPAAVAEQAIWHSPIGLIKGAYDIWDATKGKGSKDIATAINTFSKGITGTALFAIGFFLGKAGLFHVGFGRTEKERAADEMNGVQDGALVIGNFSISLDWLQPAASPLIVGASLATNMREKGWSASSMFGAVFDGTDSLFELTMLQSLYDVLGGYEAGPSGSMASIGENAASQSTPTLMGQLARAIDPVQRKTKGDNAFETAVNKVIARIPGLTYLLDPELDVWGNEVYRTGKPGTGTTVLNALQQVLIPANTKVGTGKGDPISEEILRLYADQGGAVIPTAVTRDEAAEMGEDYVDVNRLLGGANRLAVEEFVGNKKAYDVQVETGELTEKGNPRTKKVTKYYRDMTDDERRKVLSRIYKATKAEVTGDTEGKTERQLTDSERYVRKLLERVRNGERGTFDGVATSASTPAQSQANTSYYENLLRRMKNGN